MSEQYDVIVIGAGPAGYVAAIRAAQLGLKTACVDDFKGKDGKAALGGTCLNVGCIPSKALLDSSRQFWNIAHNFEVHGISTRDAKIDVGTMVGRKDKIVKQFTGGIAMLFKQNKITPYFGKARLLKERKVEISAIDGGKQTLTATNVIIATGSVPIELPFAKFDGKVIVDNAGALDFDAVPKRLGVIGAGVIGLELGSVWKRLGSDVTIIEALPDFLGAADSDIAKAAAREFAKQGLKIELGAKLSKTEVRKNEVHLTYAGKDGDKQLVVDKLLVAVGRRACDRRSTAGDGTGVKTRRSWPHRGRRALLDRSRRRVGDRRLRARADAGTQGLRGRCRSRRDHRRQSRARESGHDPMGHLHRTRDRLGRQDRGRSARPRAFRTRPAASRSRQSAAQSR